MSQQDQIYRQPRPRVADFVFDTTVAEVFPDMIRRSVPGYETVVPITGMLAARSLEHEDGGPRRVYDLGCSLGATTLAILHRIGALDCELIGVDQAPAMIERAAAAIADPRVRFVRADIRTFSLQPCRAVMLNYVLQFLPPADRLSLLARVRSALGRDGVLLLSEKLVFDNPDTQRDYDAAYLDFKRANGYSDLEISQKRTALENVMIIDTEATHRARLEAAGFSRVRKWYQCLNWASFEARP